MSAALLATPLGIALSVGDALSACVLANGVANLVVFRRPKAVIAPDTALPSVSVLAPARNEQDSIERCVRSLLRQNYPDFEVVVLDDGSSDATYDILCRLRNQDGRLRVLAGAALPDDWRGRPHALWQLAHAAHGDWLLLADAHCEYSPDALLMAVGAANEHGADVVSLAPGMIAVGFWEKILVPLLIFVPIGFAPLWLVRRPRSALIAPLSGAFVFVSRSTYFATDGHRAVKAEAAENLAFARHLQLTGKTLWYGDGSRVCRIRPYCSFSDIRQEFTRDLFPALSSNRKGLVAALIGLALLLLVPPVAALVGSLIGAPWTLPLLVPYLMAVALRWAIAAILGRDDFVYALLNPLAWLIAIAVAVGSITERRERGGE